MSGSNDPMPAQEPQILRHYIERMKMSYRALVNGCIPFESNFSPYAEYIPIHGPYLHRMCCASSIPQGITPKKTSSQSWCSTWARLDFSFWKLEFAGTPCHHLPDGFRCEDQTSLDYINTWCDSRRKCGYVGFPYRSPWISSIHLTGTSSFEGT